VKSLRRCLLASAVVLATACGVPDAPLVAPSPDGAEELPEVTATPVDDEEADALVGEPDQLEPEDATPPPPAPPWEAGEAETHPRAKELAAEIAQELTTYDPEDTPRDIADRVAADDEERDELLDAIQPLYHPGAWSRGEVEYPQFGGLTERRTSQMVVVRQTVGSASGETFEEVRTLDVRLQLRDGAWTFEELADAGGFPIERPDDLPPEAVAVLDDDRIDLPDSARWDIYRGVIERSLLGLMTRLAEEVGEYGVIVLETGHPYHVFGTDRKSDHLRGRAVDVHRIGDRLVIEDLEEGGDLHGTVEWLYEDRIRPIIGSPWALDGFGGRSFTDAVHLDHLHIAVPAPSDRDDVPDEELAP